MLSKDAPKRLALTEVQNDPWIKANASASLLAGSL
jgi:hypothetical protein